MKKEEIVILILCNSILCMNGLLENLYVSVIPFLVLKNNLKISTNNTNYSFSNTTSIYNGTKSMDTYVNNVMSLLVSVKYITRVGFGPIPGILIDKYSCLIIIIVGLVIEFVSIFISFFSYHRILIHSIMRILDAGALVCMNTSAFALIWTVFHTKGTHAMHIGMLNMLSTFGTFIGPYIGTFLNGYLGFICLPVFASFIFSNCLILSIFIFISSKQNQKYIEILHNSSKKTAKFVREKSDVEQVENVDIIDENSEEVIQNEEQIELNYSNINAKSKYRKVTFCSFFNFFRLLLNPYVFLCFFSVFISSMTVSLFSSTLTIWMINRFEVSQQKSGLVWLPGSIVSLLMPIFCILVFKRWSRIRYIGTIVSTMIQGLTCIIIPFYPQYWNTAFTISAAANSITVNEYVYFPMIFDIITDKYGPELSGRSSIITNLSFSSGLLFGGLIGGPCVNLMGFRNFYVTIGVLYTMASFLNIFMKRYST